MENLQFFPCGSLPFFFTFQFGALFLATIGSNFSANCRSFEMLICNFDAIAELRLPFLPFCRQLPDNFIFVTLMGEIRAGCNFPHQGISQRSLKFYFKNPILAVPVKL